MTAMPGIRPWTAAWPFPYSLAVGKSSSMEMNTMIPATTANDKPKNTGEMKGLRMPYPMRVSPGSATPDRKESKSAFLLLPVA